MSGDRRSSPTLDAVPDTPDAVGAGRGERLRRLAASFDERVWDPSDPAYLDLSRPFDTATEPVMPETWFPELRTPLAQALPPPERAGLGNEIIRWLLSGILRGERAAATLCRQIEAAADDPLVKACAANQAREEDRHDAAFARYIAARWGTPHPAGAAFGRFVDELIATDRISLKIVGMSVLVEGFAMGALSNIREHTHDPALARLLGLVLRDESVHHGFGALWLEHFAAGCAADEWAKLQRFAGRGFDVLCVNLLSVHQRRRVYARAGLDWRAVRAAVRSQRRDSARIPGPEETVNPLRVVARNLDRAGLIGSADRPRLQPWLQ